MTMAEDMDPPGDDCRTKQEAEHEEDGDEFIAETTNLSSSNAAESNSPRPVVTFEDVLKKVGLAGRFQIIQCLLSISCMQVMGFMNLGFVFIGYTPAHQCRQVNETELLASFNLQNDSTAQVSYGQCDVTLTSNHSGQLTQMAKFSCPDGRIFQGGDHRTLVSEWDLVCEKMGLAEIAQLLYSLGNVIGGLLVPILSDRYGRKPVMCITLFIDVIFEFIIAFSPNMYFVCTLLFFDGISNSGLSATYLIIGMEILVSKHREIYGIIVCQIWIVNVLVIALAGYLLDDVGWRYFQAFGALTGLVGLAYPFFLYESPRWLAANGQSEKALAILKIAAKQNGKNESEVSEVSKTFQKYMLCTSSQNERNVNYKEDELAGVTDLLTDEASSKNAEFANTNGPEEKEGVTKQYSLLDMFTTKESLILMLVMWYLWTNCNLTYYGIFMASSDLSGNRFLNFSLMGLVEIPANYLALFFMKRMGRLQAVRVLLTLTTVSLMSSTLLSHFTDNSNVSNSMSVALFLIGKFTITCTFNVIYIFTPEVFPTVLRTAGNGSCRSIPKIGSMLAPYIRPLYVIAKWAPGVIFTSMSFLAFILTFLLPETKGKILPTELKDIVKYKSQLSEERKEDAEYKDYNA